jgi:large subunit ribosomal protein L17
MRHQKHSNQLGVKKEHREALMANLASALIREGRIQTTLKKAKALRPFAERLVTLAKKGGLANRRLAMARIRDESAVALLFNERAGEFSKRNGGYTRIYKLGNQRLGDAAEMALIEWVGADDQGYRSTKRKPKAKAAAADKKAETSEKKAETADEKPEAADAEAKAEPEAAVEEKPEDTEPEAKAEPEASDEEKKAE